MTGQEKCDLLIKVDLLNRGDRMDGFDYISNKPCQCRNTIGRMIPIA